MTGMKVLRLRFVPVDPYNIGYEAIFSRIKRLSVLSSMMETPKKYIAVVEVIWHDAPNQTVLSDLEFFDRISEITNEGDTYLYLLSGRHLPFYSKLYAEMIESFDCFFEYPTDFTKDSICMSFVGKLENLKDFTRSLEELGMEFEVTSIKNYYVKGKGMLSLLTQKQYDCLKFAVESGFYDIPKRTETRELAEKKGMSHTTFSMHIRKAEKALFRELFD